MRYGKVALLLAIAAAALRCSGNPPVSEPGQAVLGAPSAVVINGIDHAATPAGTEVVLHGNYPFSYTSYQPDPKTLVLELLDVQVQNLSPEVPISSPQVEGVQVSTVESVDGGTIARFEFRNVLAAQHAIRLEGNDLIVDFPALGEAGAPDPSVIAAADAVEGSATGAETLMAGTSAEGAPLEPLSAELPPAGTQEPGRAVEGAPAETEPAADLAPLEPAPA
ncbi:MAG: hypothetical protein ACRD5D_02125, partial [Candidatus Polarisedimenticolia bacterium]